jgi:lipopolysaccharide biosynthesis glycosyltransferase
MKKEIPIFFACDDNYIPFLGTALHTIVRNASKEFHYRAIVLNAGINEENKERVRGVETDNLTIDFFDISAIINKHYDNLALRLRDYYSVAIYYRMFIPSLFPQYDKAIYLDADLILVGDISELYNTNIEGKLVGAINDRLVLDVPEFAAYANNAIGVAAHEYFNSGVLVMNLKKFREDNIEGKFRDLQL